MSDQPLQKTKARPVYRNIGMGDLANYRLPIIGVASIVHRITGVALFVGLILLLPMLHMSLKSEAGFEAFRTVVWGNWIARIVLIGLLFAIVYHLIAGVRHMIQDANNWMELAPARTTAIAVFVISVIVTALVAWRIMA
jgi:succinate dehydrogenase / fumarate reductase, cytochrome b subunit